VLRAVRHHIKTSYAKNWIFSIIFGASEFWYWWMWLDNVCSKNVSSSAMPFTEIVFHYSSFYLDFLWLKNEVIIFCRRNPQTEKRSFIPLIPLICLGSLQLQRHVCLAFMWILLIIVVLVINTRINKLFCSKNCVVAI